MKIRVLTILLCLTFSVDYYAQSNDDIASVYITRANAVILESIDYKQAKVFFEKAVSYLTSINNLEVAKLGSRIYYELNDFKNADIYFKEYFKLSSNKNSTDYLEQVSLYVNNKEGLDLQLIKEKEVAEAKILKELALKRIDSLKTVWTSRTLELSVKADSVFSFNKFGYAIFNSNDKFGVLSDTGEVVVNADEFVSFINYEGFMLLTDSENNPTKIFCFNTENKSGFLLPSPSELSPLSTHFGTVMLPRKNGRLVTYPNNAYEPIIYDLNQKKVVKIANLETILKALKRNEYIKKFNTEGEVKIENDWYVYGGHLGGGIHPLYYLKQYKVAAYLCTIDGTLLYTNAKYDYMGAFDENKFEARKGNETFWVNQNGSKITSINDDIAEYTGTSKIIKFKDGVYHVLKEGKIVNGDKSIEILQNFIKKNKLN